MRYKRRERLVYGVGINDADYQVSKGNWRCPFYKTWKNMLARCYSPAFQRNQPLYIGCSVDERWHRFSHFKAWMEGQDWEGKALDKDRLTNGNKIYGPDTCVFLTSAENGKSRSNTVYVKWKGFWVNLKDWCKGDASLYGYVFNNLNKTYDLEEILEDRRLATLGVVVEWEDEQVPLRDVCNKYGKDYEEVRNRRNVWSSSSVYACMFYEYNPYVSFELTGVGGVIYQFANQLELVKFLGCVPKRVVDYLPLCNGSLVELKRLISEHKQKETRTLYTIGGVSKFREDWIAFYETSEQRVGENMSKYRLSFEEAVKLPVERVKRLLVNGVESTVKDMWYMFGLDAKNANRYKSHNKITYLETLKRKGIDISGITISPL